MKIITKHYCPYCERVDMVLKLRKISSDAVHIEQIADGVFPDNYVSINPNKTFPTLQITSNFGFAESMIIAEYLDSIEAVGPKLFGENPESVAKTKFCLELLMNNVTKFLQKCIYNYGSVVEERNAVANVAKAFASLDSLLECRGTRFLGGDDLNIEDVHTAPFIMRYLASQMKNNKIPLPKDYPRAEKYFHDISHHSIVRKCIPHIEELSDFMFKYNIAKGLNVDSIKNSSRKLVEKVNESIQNLNSKCSNFEWQLGQNSRGNFIYSKINYKTPQECINALQFLNEIQEAADHHTSFTVENFSTLNIEICTHSPKYGVTEMDIAFAEFFSKASFHS